VLNVTPIGTFAGINKNVGEGAPVAVTVNDPAVPTVKVVLEALVIIGAVGVATVSVKFWLAFGKMPFDALKVKG
jgi:hypothetical protein